LGTVIRWAATVDSDCPATFAEGADMKVEAGGRDNGKRA
jgi:hypothetical protein